MSKSRASRSLVWLLVAVLLGGIGLSAFAERTHAATNYYVSPSGSDTTGAGTSASPWKTIAYAAAHVPAGAGNTIVLSAGTFTESQPIQLPVGVNVTGAGVSQTTISAGSLPFVNGRNELFLLISSSHATGNQTLSGFKIDGQSKALEAGFHVEARDNVVIHDVNVQNTKHTAMRIIAGWSATDTTAPPFYLTGIQVYNCALTNVSQDLSGWTSGAILIGGVDGALIHHNTINENAGFGIKFENKGWFKGLKVYNNTINTNSNDPVWGADASLEFWNIYEGSEIYNNTLNNWVSLVNRFAGTGTTLTFHDNSVINTRDDTPVAGIELAAGNAKVYNNYLEQFRWGVGMWQEKYVSNNEIYSNVFYNRVLPADAYNSGIFFENLNVGYAYDNNKIYNNYFNKFEQAVWYKIVGNSPITNTKFQNNIVEDMSYALILTASDTNYLSNTTMTYNVMNNVPTVLRGLGAAPNNLVTTNNLTGNPGLTKSGAKPDPYFRPSSSSSLVVNAGTNVGLPYSGSAPDIGRYEWTGTGGGTDTTAPSAPTGLASPSKTDTTVNLTWTASTDNVGVAGYDVYRGTTKVNASLIAGTSYTVTGLAASTAYSFTVKAKDAAGNESAASAAVSVTTNASSSGSVSYEAEATANTLTGGAWKATCSTCSGGYSVNNIGNNDGTLQFNGVSAPSAGSYTVRVYYKNGDASARTGLVSVNGGSAITVTFAPTGSWTTVGYVDVTVSLNAGSNTIKFYHNAGSYAPDFDKLTRQ